MELTERQVYARNVTPGDRVTVIPGERIERVHGQFPKITATRFAERGEGLEPTVYLTVTGMPWRPIPLAPEALVTIVDRG